MLSEFVIRVDSNTWYLRNEKMSAGSDGASPYLSNDDPGGSGPPSKMLRQTDNGMENLNANANKVTTNVEKFERFATSQIAVNKSTPNNNNDNASAMLTDEAEDATQFTSFDMPVDYDEQHKGPFVVYVDTKIAEPRTPINQFKLTKKLIDLKVDNIDSVLKVGYSRCKVFFRTRIAANNFAKNLDMEKAGYSVKIFTHLLTKTGIIFNIPEEISMKELSQWLSAPVPIVKLIRMTRKDTSNNKQRIPTMKVKVVFKGLQIPREIDFAYTKVTTKPFISFGQCYNCYRFNHLADNCKQKEQTCKICFSRHDEATGCDTSVIKCNNCNDQHPPTDRNCPAREKALNLKRLMVLENLSLKEARAKYAGIMGGNRFEILGEEGIENNFPQMRTKPDKFINNTREASRFIHKAQPYSKVLKTNVNRQREEANAKRNMEEYRQITRDFNQTYNEPRNMDNPHIVSEVEKMMTNLKSIINSSMSSWTNDIMTQSDRNFLKEVGTSIEKALNNKDRNEILAFSGNVTENFT